MQAPTRTTGWCDWWLLTSLCTQYIQYVSYQYTWNRFTNGSICQLRRFTVCYQGSLHTSGTREVTHRTGSFQESHNKWSVRVNALLSPRWWFLTSTHPSRRRCSVGPISIPVWPWGTAALQVQCRSHDPINLLLVLHQGVPPRCSRFLWSRSWWNKKRGETFPWLHVCCYTFLILFSVVWSHFSSFLGLLSLSCQEGKFLHLQLEIKSKILQRLPHSFHGKADKLI